MDPMTMMLATTALSGGLSFMSGIGQQSSVAKQNRLQMMENARVDNVNWERTQALNQQRQALGEAYLNVPEWQARDWQNFRDVGTALGYNPVTWLNSGAMSLFKKDYLGGMKMMVGEQGFSATPTQIQRVPSTMEAVGNAGIAALNTFQGMYKTIQSQDFQWNMLDRQLQAMAGLRGAGGTVGATPSNASMFGFGAASGSGMSSGGAASKTGGLSAMPYPQNWKPGDVEGTNPWGRGFIDETVSDAGAKENRYGEPGDWLFGIDTMVHDAVRNLSGRTLRAWGEAAGMNIGSYKLPGDTSWAPAFQRWWASPNSLPNAKLPGFGGSVTPYAPFPGAY